MIFISILFIYGRFIEPQIILENEHKINVGFKGKIVVISDIHLGIYKDVNFLNRVVEKINEMKNIDAVLIAGDLTYEPNDDISTLFAPLKDLKYTTYAVIGNHDDGHPGIPIVNEIKVALKRNNVTYLHNTATNIPNTNIKLLGLGDSWENKDDITLINNYNKEDNLIVLTHNPDTSLRYSKQIGDLADVTITGHTHGGQVRIPIYYKTIIPTSGNFDEGFYNYSGAKVFVSSGLGEVGLPMRLFIPPVIDILDFN